MTLWKQWLRKRDGWVERKRRFQREFAEGFREAARQKVPAVATAAVPETSPAIRKRGAK